VATIAEIIIRATDQASSALKGIGSAATTMAHTVSTASKQMGQSLQNAVKGAEDIGKLLAQAGAAGMGAFGMAAKSAADFEAELKNTMTMTGLTGTKFDEMEVKVKDMANTMATKFGVTGQEVLKSYYYVLSTGVQAGSKGFKTLSDAAMGMSKVVGTDLSSSVTYIADVTKIWGKTMEESAHTADILFKGSQLGNTTVEQLAEAMNMGGKAAATLGISMEDTAAILVAFADNGLKGSEAGTALKQVLMKLAAPPKEAAAALAQLGVQVYAAGSKMADASSIIADLKKALKGIKSTDLPGYFSQLGVSMKDASGKAKPMKDVLIELEAILKKGITPAHIAVFKKMGVDTAASAGNMRPMVDILKDLQDKLKGVSEEERNKAMADIAGLDAMQAFGAVLNMNTENIKSQSEAMQKTNMINDALKKKMDTLSEQYKVMKEHIMQVVRIIGDTLLPVLKEKVKLISDLTKKVADYLKAHPKLTAFLAKWGSMGSVIAAAAGAAILALTGMISMAGTILGALGAIIAAVFSPLGIAIALMVAGIKLAFDRNFLGIKDTVVNFVKLFQAEWVKIAAFIKQDNMKGALDELKNLFGTVWDGIVAKVTEVKGKLATEFNGIKQKITEAIAAITLVIQPFADAFKQVATAVQGFVGSERVHQFFKSLKEILPQVTPLVKEFGPALLAAAAGFAALSAASGPATAALQAFLAIFIKNPIVAIVLGALALLYEGWTKNWGGMRDFLQPVVTSIQQWLTGLVTWFQSGGLQGMLAQAKVWWDNLMNGLKAAADVVIPLIQQAWQGLVKFFTPIIAELMNTTVPALQEIWVRLQADIAKFVQDIGPPLQELWRSLTELWKEIEPYVLQFVGFMQQYLIAQIPLWTEAFKGWFNYWEYAWNNIFSPILTKVVIPICSGIVNEIVLMIKLIENTFNGMTEIINRVKAVFDGLKQAIIAALNTIKTAVTNWTSSTFGGLITKLNQLQSLIDRIKGKQSQLAGAQAGSGSSVGNSSSGGSSKTSKSIIIQGNIYGGSSGLRELEGTLSKYTGERLARGVA